MPPPWSEAAAKVGGVAELAEALGIGTMTLYRWATGTHKPAKVTAEAVATWFKRRGLGDPWAPGDPKPGTPGAKE
jgi:hypothetical protein